MSWNPFTPKRIYLDFAAATPLLPRVRRVMSAIEEEVFANASGTHQEAQIARAILEEARREIARTLVTTPNNIIFTSGGTESNNLALFGIIENLKDRGRSYGDMEVVTTAIEHPSIIEPLRVLEKKGIVVRSAPLDAEGKIKEKEFQALITEKTVLITCAYANSEIGTVQDIKTLSRIVRQKRKEFGTNTPSMHIDASQAPLWLPCKMDSLGVDLMTLDAGKCYGPKGSGILALRGDVTISPFIRGGSQEGDMRPGTENVALAAGAAFVLARAQAGQQQRALRTRALRNAFIQELQVAFPTLVINGPLGVDSVAHIVNVSISGIDGEYAVAGLDHRGVACSTRSACKGNEEGGSHVLRALGFAPDRVLGAIRFSLGEDTTSAKLQKTVAILKEHAAIASKVKLPQ